MLKLSRYLYAALFLVGFQSQASAIKFESGSDKVHLLELYSSQGCSSCPPAQQWVNQIEDSELLWQRVIPIVFHVDYWDYLGWKDPYSQQQFSFRQRAHKHQGNVNSVYTPGFVVSGKEWKGWFRGNNLSLEDNAVGNLSIEMHDESFVSRFIPEAHTDRYPSLQLNIATLAMNKKTRVTAGENRSRELQESFIVLDLQQYTSDDASTESVVNFAGKMNGVQKADALVAWISAQDDLQPIQVTGGYLID